MAGYIYFGNANHQAWIKAPSSGMQVSQSGWQNQTTRSNGRIGLKRSNASARSFNPSWIGSLNSESESLQIINDFANGFYGSGPFYWVDPFAMNQNILAPHWAAPGLCEKDWPTIYNGSETYASGNKSVNGYPITSMVIDPLGSSSPHKFTVIIPPGYSFHFGLHSTVGGLADKVKLHCINRNNPYTSNDLFPLSLDTTSGVRTNAIVNGDVYRLVEININAGDIAIAGMIGQILPNGTSVATGDFISGRGTTALEFAQPPVMEYYSANLNNGQVGMSATLVEVE